MLNSEPPPSKLWLLSNVFSRVHFSSASYLDCAPRGVFEFPMSKCLDNGGTLRTRQLKIQRLSPAFGTVAEKIQSDIRCPLLRKRSYHNRYQHINAIYQGSVTVQHLIANIYTVDVCNQMLDSDRSDRIRLILSLLSQGWPCMVKCSDQISIDQCDALCGQPVVNQ